MRGHIDTETLAAFREGLLSRRQAARVAAHLPGCPRCADTDAQLAGVTATLAASPVPPMPAGLTDRIAAALAAEAASRSATAPASAAREALEAVPTAGVTDAARGAGGPAGAPVARSTTGGGHGRPRVAAGGRGRSWLTLRVAAVTAAVAVIAGGGYGLSQVLSNTSSSESGSGAASGTGSGAVNGAQRSSAAAPAVPSAASLRQLRVVHSRTNYDAQHLASQAMAVLAQTGPAASHAGPQSQPQVLPHEFGLFANVPGCVARVAAGRAPKLVDLASYQGKSALTIMIPDGHNRVRVVVVGSGCSAAADDVLAQTVVKPTG
jgi:hypothetical protein